MPIVPFRASAPSTPTPPPPPDPTFVAMALAMMQAEGKLAPKVEPDGPTK